MEWSIVLSLFFLPPCWFLSQSLKTQPRRLLNSCRGRSSSAGLLRIHYHADFCGTVVSIYDRAWGGEDIWFLAYRRCMHRQGISLSPHVPWNLNCILALDLPSFQSRPRRPQEPEQQTGGCVLSLWTRSNLELFLLSSQHNKANCS